MRAWRPLLMLLLAATAGGACSRDGAPTIAATVEGKPVTATEIRRLADRYLQSEPGKELAEDNGRRGVEQLLIGFLIKRSYLEHVAASMGVGAEPDPGAEALTVLADADA